MLRYKLVTRTFNIESLYYPIMLGFWKYYMEQHTTQISLGCNIPLQVLINMIKIRSLSDEEGTCTEVSLWHSLTWSMIDVRTPCHDGLPWSHDCGMSREKSWPAVWSRYVSRIQWSCGGRVTTVWSSMCAMSMSKCCIFWGCCVTAKTSACPSIPEISRRWFSQLGCRLNQAEESSVSALYRSQLAWQEFACPES